MAAHKYAPLYSAALKTSAAVGARLPHSGSSFILCMVQVIHNVNGFAFCKERIKE